MSMLIPRLLPLIALLPLLSGCGDKPESRELRVLREANESLRQRLTATEEALAEARAELERRPPAPAEPTMDTSTAVPSANAARDLPPPQPAPTGRVEDTHYIVVAKHHVPGQLIPQPSGADPSATRRTAPVYQVTFRGEQSAKTYPPLSVTELAYPRFREGASYPRAVLNASKLTTGTEQAPATLAGPTAPGGEPPIDFESIFGSP